MELSSSDAGRFEVDRNMTVKKEIEELLELVDDPRCLCDVQIPLFDILVIAIAFVMSGMTDFSELGLYLETHGDELKRRFEIQHIPSERTMRRVLAAIKPVQLGIALLYMLRRRIHTPGDVIAVDGKAIRSTERKYERGLRILTAYDVAGSMAIGQLEVGPKTNEIPVMLELLSLLELSGRIVTADAMHCQKATCAQIIEQQGDYVLQVKGNQSALLEYTQVYMDDLISSGDPCLDKHRSASRGHGRYEVRTCYMAPVPEDDELAGWSGLRTMVAMDRETTDLATGETSQERSYYISSLLGTSKHLSQIIRDHWQIESMHWSLDVVFQEDACRVRDPNLHLNLNLLRKLALSIHKNFLAKKKASGEKKFERRSMRLNMKACFLDVGFLMEVLQTCDLEAVEAEMSKA